MHGIVSAKSDHGGPPDRRDQVAVRSAETADIQVVALRGAVDRRLCRLVSSAMARVFAAQPTAVVVDLSQLRTLDRDGAALIILIRRHARRLGSVLSVAGANPAVVATLRDLHVDGLLRFYPTVASAVDALSTPESLRAAA